MSPSAHVVFIHGLWIHASAWKPWQELFESKGYTTSAPGWPGDGDTVASTRGDPDALAGIGIEAICHHYRDLFEQDGVTPIVVGHSFGGLIAQLLLANGYAVAAVAIDPAPIKGVKSLPFSQLRSAFPVLLNPANKNRTVSLTQSQFRYAFGNAITETESNTLFDRWTIPGPGRPLFEDASANFKRNSPAEIDTHAASRGPLLLASGSLDHTVPASVTRAVKKLYAGGTASLTDYHEYEGKGHSLTIDSGWSEVARDALEWLEAQGHGPGSGGTADTFG